MMTELSLRELEAETLVELPERQLMTGLSIGANLAICIDLDLGVNVGGGAADCGDDPCDNSGGGSSDCGARHWGR